MACLSFLHQRNSLVLFCLVKLNYEVWMNMEHRYDSDRKIGNGQILEVGCMNKAINIYHYYIFINNIKPTIYCHKIFIIYNKYKHVHQLSCIIKLPNQVKARIFQTIEFFPIRTIKICWLVFKFLLLLYFLLPYTRSSFQFIGTRLANTKIIPINDCLITMGDEWISDHKQISH